MRYLLHTVMIVAMTAVLTACERTVTAEGYVAEYPHERYMRNLPKGYGGQRPVLLKPPAPVAPATQLGMTYAGAPDQQSMMMSAGSTDYTSHPIPAPQYSAPAPVMAAPIMTPPGDMGTPYGSPQPLSPMSGYDSAMMPPPQQIQLTPPSAIITREVDYGREITVYPLDRADAPMPYIAPATPMYDPPVNQYKPTRTVPAGVNN